MKFASFDGGRVDIILGDEIADITTLCGITPGSWPPIGMLRLIAGFPALAAGLKEATAAAPRRKLSTARLETPIA